MFSTPSSFKSTAPLSIEVQLFCHTFHHSKQELGALIIIYILIKLYTVIRIELICSTHIGKAKLLQYINSFYFLIFIIAIIMEYVACLVRNHLPEAYNLSALMTASDIAKILMHSMAS